MFMQYVHSSEHIASCDQHIWHIKVRYLLRAHTHTQTNGTNNKTKSSKQSIKSRELTVKINVALAACYQYLAVVVPGRAAVECLICSRQTVPGISPPCHPLNFYPSAAVSRS